MIPAVLTCCAGIDIGKRNLAVCLMVGPADSEPRVEVREILVIERPKDANFRAVGERFRASGRMLPPGAIYQSSWIGGSRCFH